VVVTESEMEAKMEAEMETRLEATEVAKVL
jgi:hypothetical protein